MRHHIVTQSLCHRQKLTGVYYQHTMGTKIAIPEMSLNAQNLFFRKAAYSRYEVITTV
jgi:hypothetical protein